MSDAARGRGHVALRDVRRRWGTGERGTVALDGVTLEIETGTHVALQGPSGSGKSTLLNVIGGLDRRFTGEVDVGGVSLRGLGDRAMSRFRNRTVGFVFQSFHLLPHLSLLDNVLVPTAFGAGRGDAAERARTLLDRVGLAARVDARPNELSGGQQQRVAIARALMNDAAVLLCDEPTGSLDAEAGARVLDLLEEVAADRGATLIVVTHEPDVAARAQRRITLRDGRVVDDEAEGAA